MKVFITGASGFVGKHLCHYLSRAGFEVMQLSRSNTPSEYGIVARYDFGKEKNEAELDTLVMGTDTVIHLLGVAHVVGANQKDEATYYKVNVEYAKRMFSSAVRCGVDRFIYISSVKAHGESCRLSADGKAIAIKTTDDDSPEDVYGKSKLSAEKELLRLAAESRTELLILRLPLVYGVGQKGNLKSLFRLIKSGWPLPLKCVNNTRSLLGVKNFCDAINLVLNQGSFKKNIYYLADVHISTAHLVSKISAAHKAGNRLFPVPVCILEVVAGLLGRKAMARKLLGSLFIDSDEFAIDYRWKPSYSADEIIAEIVEFNDE